MKLVIKNHNKLIKLKIILFLKMNFYNEKLILVMKFLN